MATSSTVLKLVADYIGVFVPMRAGPNYVGLEKEVLHTSQQNRQRTYSTFVAAFNTKDTAEVVQIIGYNFSHSKQLTRALSAAAQQIQGKDRARSVKALEIIGCAFAHIQIL